ncbi:MAG: lipopolysaccharide transport periplasmic protein LptA [Deltaproteobacteria bacterium]|nr:lipopolysaccharide transport periplasmic protein LptA [Deltaproteobacteria bacterium]
MLKSFLLTGLVFLAAVALPTPRTEAQTTDSDAPIHIEADRMVSKQNDNAIVFTGNVDARQGALTIHSDEMTVYHKNQPATKSTGQEGPQKIEKLYAVGNVKIVQEELVATGNSMEYFAEGRKVLLTGDTKVWQDNNLVTGEKILLDLNAGTTVVEPDSKTGGRVKAFFNPATQ